MAEAKENYKVKRMYNEEEKNEQFIGYKLKNSRLKQLAEEHSGLTQVIITVITLVVFLEAYAGVTAARNFFGSEPVTRNPILLLIDLVGHHPLVAIVVFGAVYLIGRKLTENIISDKVARYEENARGELIDNNGLHGRGKIADRKEIETYMVYTDDDHTIGTVVGRDEESGKAICKPYVAPGSITDFANQLKNDHMLVCGPSSSGKTTNFIPHNIINHLLAGHSLITTDPSGELYSMLAPICRMLDYKVRILNLRPSEMSHSDGCDLLKPLRNADDPESMADDFCVSILMNVGTGKESFWNDANKNLLSLVLLYVAKANNFKPITKPPQKDENGNLLAASENDRVFREVAAYIEDPVAMKANIEQAIIKDPYGDGKLLGGRFRTWSKNKEADQIASGLSTALSIFRNSWVSEILSQDDMSVDMLTEDKAIYFIILDPLNDSFKPVTSLYFTTVFQELFRIAVKLPQNRLPRMIYIFLEELQSLGLITKLPAALDNIRKHNVGMALCTQELAVLEEIYGTGTTLNMLNDCLVQMCMGTNADHPSAGIITNASFFSKMSGTQTYREDYVTENRHKWIPEKWQEITVLDQSQRMQSGGAEVYMTDDVYRIDGEHVLVRASMHNPFMAKRFFWKSHPLSEIYVRNRYTGENYELKACDHIPHYMSGEEELFDTDLYEIYNAREKKRYARTASSGVSYDKFL